MAKTGKKTEQEAEAADVDNGEGEVTEGTVAEQKPKAKAAKTILAPGGMRPASNASVRAMGMVAAARISAAEAALGLSEIPLLEYPAF